MKILFLAILFVTLLTNCHNSENNTAEKNSRMELIPEHDKAIKEEYEKQKKVSQPICFFSNPDTSVAGIKIRDVESTIEIIGNQTKLEGDSTHFFYSSDKKQILGLSVHSGDSYSQVSIFNISYSNNPKQNFPQIDSKEFETEKGIKLAISKKEIIKKLGTCYLVRDSSKNHITLCYKIEFPSDSRTKLLKRNKMPIYYATYELANDKLENIEFGFEYP